MDWTRRRSSREQRKRMEIMEAIVVLCVREVVVEECMRVVGFIELEQPSVTLPDKACMRVQISKKMHRQEKIFASSIFYLFLI